MSTHFTKKLNLRIKFYRINFYIIKKKIVKDDESARSKRYKDKCLKDHRRESPFKYIQSLRNKQVKQVTKG